VQTHRSKPDQIRQVTQDKTQTAFVKTVQYKQSQRPVRCYISASIDVLHQSYGDGSNKDIATYVLILQRKLGQNLVFSNMHSQICCKMWIKSKIILQVNNNYCSPSFLGLSGSTCPTTQLHMPENLNIQFREFVWNGIFLEKEHIVMHQALRVNCDLSGCSLHQWHPYKLGHSVSVFSHGSLM
jgi:hypothetical protein